MNSKYNTGHPIDINDLSKEERKMAFHEWAEGSQALEKLLNEGYEKGLLSRACCAGHEKEANPYVLYELNDDNSRKMAMYLAQRLVDSDLDCKLSFMDNFSETEEEYIKMREHLLKTFPADFSEEKYSPTRTITELGVYTRMENREEVFKIMAEYIKEAELDNIELPKNREEIPCKDFRNVQLENGKKMIDEIVNQGINEGVAPPEMNAAIQDIRALEINYQQEQQGIVTPQGPMAPQMPVAPPMQGPEMTI